ncbi:MAG TPA: AAA domain-containing protein [Candidatus Dormibacteraeota bacterium]|nr:AAA domain-containing protein [Candidatus Dormibacteraeota bacterium]
MSVIPLPRVAPDDVRDRAVRLFTFLREYTQLRASTALTTDAYDEVIWLADVPGLPGCVCAAVEPSRDGEVWLEVRKPRLTPAPRPPEPLRPWLERWDDSAAARPALRDSIPDLEPPPPEEADEAGPRPPLLLTDHPEIQAAYDDYVAREWRPWGERDRPLQRAQRIYTDLFRLHQSQQRLGEAYEVVMGIGLLAWRTPSGETVRRHLVVAQTDVRFDADRGVISVTAAADGARPALEQDMLQPGERPPRAVLDEIVADLAGVGDDVFADPAVASAARRWAHGASARGRFDDTLQPVRDVDEDPTVHLAPAVILRRRSERSIVQALTAIAEQLRAGGPIPEGVRRLVDLAESGIVVETPDALPDPDEPAAAEREEVLFPLPANDTQLDIVRRLRDRPGVLVQGPPGTGKSHTIANLVAHLLANGQRVLVTSHTARALEVLRDRIPPEVRELAVVVLGNDARGREELQASVHGISERYSSWDAGRSRQRVARHRSELEAARGAEEELRGRLRELRERDTLRHARAFGAYEGTAQEIARQLRARALELAWIPDRVELAAEPPLDDAEALALLELLRSIDALEEAELDTLTAEIELLPDAEAFAAMVAEEREAVEKRDELGTEPDPALAAAPPAAVEALAAAVTELRRRQAGLTRRAEPWGGAAAAAVTAGMAGRWRELERMTREALDAVRPYVQEADASQVTGVEGHDLAAVQADATALREHLQRGGGLGVGPIRAEPVRRAKYLVDRVRVNGSPCRDMATLGRLIGWAYVHDRLARLDAAWAPFRQPAAGGPALRAAEYADVAATLEDVLRLEEATAGAVQAATAIPGLSSPAWEDDAALAELLRAIEAAGRERRLEAVRAELDVVRSATGAGHEAERALRIAVEDRDALTYALRRPTVQRLAERRDGLRRRRQLGDRLRAAAPRLASRLAATAADPSWDARLGAFTAAWEWARADAWLVTQADPTLVSRLERDLDDARLRIERATRGLAAELAWAHCLNRLSERERAHLQTWEEAVRKIGKGTGKHAARWRQRARDAMHGCRSAIPAWIMPIFKVAETVDMTPEAFDVVIVDEASQSGPEALFLQFLARRVIVVGDDQQISPDNVGVDRDKVQFLNTQYLHDVPLAMHYDADTSYFTHAAIRYGDRLVLQEHFRCMPEIIQFSNSLCYRDRPLVPLRQFGSDRLRPAIQVRRVHDGVYGDGQVNEAEALALVEQVVACLDDPAYAGKTMGVISLVGSEQAKLIARLLAPRVDPAEMERRRLLCGDAYAFQGDERDVMFLSLVQAPRDGRRLYAGTADRDRRRFNVAASRARDQLWLFHSATLDDLHPSGVAHRLLHYCLQPQIEPAPARGLAVEAWRRRVAERAAGDRPPHPFDSWLELDVFLALADRGYRVIPQHEVAGYRVDLMVEGRSGRLAVECDGDQWGGPDVFEQELARQRVLERCGLPFARVRGAAFYRDPEAALEPLWADLKQYDVRPVQGSAGR